MMAKATWGEVGAWAHARTGHSRGMMAGVLAILGLVISMVAPLATPAAAEWSAPRTVYIDQTGQTLDQVFLDVWRDNGGADSYGYPITSEITLANSHVVQYFQYARFEYWPEGDADGVHFHLGDIGSELQPLSVPRSLAAVTSTSKAKSAAADAQFRIARVWLPVTNTDLAADTRFVDATKHTVTGAFRTYWENTGEDAYLGNPLSEVYTTHGNSFQVFERGQLTLDKDGSAKLVPLGQVLADRYKLDQSAVAQGDVPTYSEDLFVAPPAPAAPSAGNYVEGGGEVWVDVNLSTQYMVIYQGNTVIGETYISSGRPGFDTPTGEFFVNTKLISDDMEGVLGGEYYNVPEVPDVMYFTDVGHAIHGTYWHNNFGTPMSHGCINMPMDMAAWLFGIAPIGMRVEIHY